MLSTMNTQDSGAAAASSVGAGVGTAKTAEAASWREYCRICEDTTCVSQVLMPYVFRYLANELAGMGIKLTLDVERL